MHPKAILNLLGFALCTTFHSAFATDITNPTIDLGYAIYQGAFNATSNITRFLGIRYAAPPIGAYR